MHINRTKLNRFVAIFAAVLFAAQLFTVSGVSTAMAVAGAQVDAFGNPICTSRGDKPGDAPGHDHALECCSFCFCFGQFVSFVPPSHHAVVFNPFEQHLGMSSVRAVPVLLRQRNQQALPRAPPLQS